MKTHKPGDIPRKIPHNTYPMSERKPPEPTSTNKTTINSEGGPVIQGDATANRDFAGRDITNNYYDKQNPEPKPEDPWDQFAKIPTDTIPNPGPIAPQSLLSHHHNQNFVGRETELRLLAWLISGRGDVQAAAVAIAATGLGGIGKTQLAAEFCHRYGRYFAGGVFWLSFDNEANGRTAIAQCATKIEPNWANQNFETKIESVLHNPNGWQANISRLIVFDNIEDHVLLDKYLPATGGGRVLLTSRKGDWEQSGLNVTPLPLKPLSRDESIFLLQKTVKRLRNNDDDMGAIAAELGDFPLALHLAGSFLQKYPTESVDKYLTKLRRFDLMGELGKQAGIIEKGPINPTAHTWHIARTFEMSYAQIRPFESPTVEAQRAGSGSDADKAQYAAPLQNDIDLIKWAARRLLARAALLAPGEPIPIDLLFATFKTESEKPLFELDEYQLQDALNLLTHLGLVEPVEFGADQQLAILLHRLTNAFTRNNVESSDDDLPRLKSQLDQTTTQLHLTHRFSQLRAYKEHLRHVVEYEQEQQDIQLATLMNTLGFLLQEEGNFHNAKFYFESSKKIRELRLKENHPEIATSLNNLAYLLLQMGDIEQGIIYCEKAINIRRHEFGEKHQYTATSYSNLGMLLQSKGELKNANTNLEKALAIHRKTLGNKHLDTAKSLDNLGMVKLALEKFRPARNCIEEALKIHQELLGDYHPATALSMNNMGVLYDSMGNFEKAKPYFEEALKIQRQTLGEKHPHTAQSLNNLAVLAYYQNDLKLASSFMYKAWEIRNSTLGSMHPSTLNSRQNLEAIEAKQLQS
jgi:tetratricopeptide (TPR) repeat protein